MCRLIFWLIVGSILFVLGVAVAGIFAAYVLIRGLIYLIKWSICLGVLTYFAVQAYRARRAQNGELHV